MNNLAFPYKGCSEECGESKDWNTESTRIARYFGSAYCTIAATSARDSTEGFLVLLQAGQCVKIPNDSESALYVCEAIDNFNGHVEIEELNNRAWVL